MTLSNTSPRVTLAGNGALISFSFLFKVWAASDLKVYLRDTATLVDTLQALNSDYTVSVASYPGSGSVVFNTPPASTKLVIILRDAATTQDLDLIANGAFAAENVETAIDKVVGYVQALEEQSARAALLPVGTALTGLTLPEPTMAKAGRALAINNSGDGYTDVAYAIASASVSSYIATLIDDADAPTARQTLGLRTLRQTGITYDPSSVLNGNETESANIAVAGAAFGDSVQVFPPYDLQGLACWGYVKASGQVRIRLRNGTGGTVDLANSAGWEVWVWKGGQA